MGVKHDVTSKPKASFSINIHVLHVDSDHCMQTSFYNTKEVSSNFVSHLTQNYSFIINDYNK